MYQLREKGEGFKGKTLTPFIGEAVLPFSLPSSPFTIKGILINSFYLSNDLLALLASL